MTKEELQIKVKKTINWHVLYRILMELEANNKIEKLKAKAGFFWKKKKSLKMKLRENIYKNQLILQ